jgi:hypothetical protein
MRASVDVDLVFDRSDAAGRDRLRADPEGIGPARNHGLLIHPDHVGGKLVSDLGSFCRLGEDISAADVDFVSQSKGHRIAGFGARKFAIVCHDLLDARIAARCRNDDFVANRNAAGGDRSGVAAEIEVRPVHPLHRETEGQIDLVHGHDHVPDAQERANEGVALGLHQDASRPWRSESFATCISATMSSMVAASDSMAPLSG